MDLQVFKLASKIKHHKLLKNYDYIIKQKNSFCGDEIVMSIKIKSQKIHKIGYHCNSCLYTQASASLLSSFLEGKNLDDIEVIKMEINKFFKKEIDKLPKKFKVFSKIINVKNFSRKDCLMLPIITLSKLKKKIR